MNPAAILAAIDAVAGWAQLVMHIGGDVAPFITTIKKWSSGTSQPTHDDFVALAASAKPFLDKLNDTSKDKA